MRFSQQLKGRVQSISPRVAALFLVVVLCGAIGLNASFRSHAATPTASIEAENGALAGSGCAVSDTSASGGSAVKFGASCAGAPATPAATGATICGNSSQLDGPTTAPSGAITVAAGNNSSVNFGTAGATYYFATGTHTIGTGQFSQIQPGNNSTFVGAPGAIIDGQGLNKYAIVGNATGVTVKYLTIQNFGSRTPNTLTTPSGDINNEGTVNHNAGHNWTLSHNTIQYNGGAGVFGGTGDTISYNCLTKNGQYGFSFYEDNDVSNVVVDHNEISYNDTYDWESKIDGCGCTGGGKFWATNGAVITNNYDHDNYSNGMWADTNNIGFDVEGNYFAGNDGPAFEYEISYNLLIKNNTFVNNAIPAGTYNPGFPEPAVYLSESGSDSRVKGPDGVTAAPYGANTLITGNVFTDNWGGVALWESSDRFCSSSANTSSGTCTLVNPAANLTTCANNTSQSPYFDDCRWKTQNVKVTGNTFNSTPANINSYCSGYAAGHGGMPCKTSVTCTSNNSCGLNALLSQYGSYAPYTGWVVPTHIINSQNNTYSGNTYNGTWNFMAFNQSDTVTFTQWKAGFNDGNGSGVHVNGQDAGSTLN